MSRCTISRLAAADIASILAWTHTNFGQAARLRYEALLTQAINDLSRDPKRFGRVDRPEISQGVFTYHLFHSRNNVPRTQGRVKKPRHFLLCRTGSGGAIDIGRVLHDAMDLERHLPFRLPAWRVRLIESPYPRIRIASIRRFAQRHDGVRYICHGHSTAPRPPYSATWICFR